MSWLSSIVQSIKDGDLEGAVAKTQDGIANISKDLQDTIQEKVSEVDAEANEIKLQKEKMTETKNLPWECNEDQSIVAEELMERILSLSLDESTFLEEPTPPTYFDFDMETHVQLITRLLELDPNLAKAHYKLSAKMDERIFWEHYFHRIALLRADVGVSPSLRVKRQSSIERQMALKKKSTSNSNPSSNNGNNGVNGNNGGSGSEHSQEPFAGSEASMIDLEGLNDELNDDGLDDDDGLVDLDALDAEVNAELDNDDFNLNSDDEIDDDGALDAELEAEIEAELGE